MTESEWNAQAEEYERKAQEAFERGDETEAERCSVTAQACRHNACYGAQE